MRRDFGNLGIRYNFHKMYEHNLWSYVYYIILISDKVKENKPLTKDEKYIYDLYIKKVYSWMPLNRDHIRVSQSPIGRIEKRNNEKI